MLRGGCPSEQTEADLRGLPPPQSAAAAIGALCVPRPVSSCARALTRWLTDVSAPLFCAKRVGQQGWVVGDTTAPPGVRQRVLWC